MASVSGRRAETGCCSVVLAVHFHLWSLIPEKVTSSVPACSQLCSGELEKGQGPVLGQDVREEC